MREHGVLNRLMLVYEATTSPPASSIESIHQVIHRAASLVRSFIEDYHGMLEENFVFPEFERRRKHGALVTTLRHQHRVGRSLTGVILEHATEAGLANANTRAELTRACHDFIRMFRAHEAWEDTELFPAFRRLVPVPRLLELGHQFEEIERRTFGEEGYAEIVRQVAQLEHHAGIDHLERFTAREPAPAFP